MRIWRLTISTKPKEGIDARMFCIQNNFIGVGWQVDQDAPMDWQTYYRLGNEMYRERGHEGWWPAVNAIRVSGSVKSSMNGILRCPLK